MTNIRKGNAHLDQNKSVGRANSICDFFISPFVHSTWLNAVNLVDDVTICYFFNKHNNLTSNY
jgi:hypothetical protein